MTQVVAGTNYKVIYKRTNAAATESDQIEVVIFSPLSGDLTVTSVTELEDKAEAGDTDADKDADDDADEDADDDADEDADDDADDDGAKALVASIISIASLSIVL